MGIDGIISESWKRAYPHYFLEAAALALERHCGFPNCRRMRGMDPAFPRPSPDRLGQRSPPAKPAAKSMLVGIPQCFAQGAIRRAIRIPIETPRSWLGPFAFAGIAPTVPAATGKNPCTTD